MEKARQIIDDNAELSDDRLANKVSFSFTVVISLSWVLGQWGGSKKRAGERKRSEVRERE